MSNRPLKTDGEVESGKPIDREWRFYMGIFRKRGDERKSTRAEI